MGKKISRFRSTKNAKSKMLQRTEESARNTSGGNKWRDYISEDFTGKKWRVAEGEHILDIIPYLSGDHDPKVDAETPTYFLDLWVHQRVGVTEDAYICPASNYKGQRCPICEHVAKMKASGNFDDDEIRQFTPKRRVMYNIVCYDTDAEEAKGVQVWEASYHLTENELVELARNRRGAGYLAFSDPDEGKSLSFIRKGKGVGTRYKGWQFEDRVAPIEDEILDQAYTLDDIIHIPSYEELEEAFAPTAPEIEAGNSMGDDVPLGMGGVEEEEEVKPRRSRAPLSNSHKKEESVEEESVEEEKPTVRSTRRRR